MPTSGSRQSGSPKTSLNTKSFLGGNISAIGFAADVSSGSGFSTTGLPGT
jgi:hypothetical protein